MQTRTSTQSPHPVMPTITIRGSSFNYLLFPQCSPDTFETVVGGRWVRAVLEGEGWGQEGDKGGRGRLANWQTEISLFLF